MKRHTAPVDEQETNREQPEIATGAAPIEGDRRVRIEAHKDRMRPKATRRAQTGEG